MYIIEERWRNGNGWTDQETLNKLKIVTYIAVGCQRRSSTELSIVTLLHRSHFFRCHESSEQSWWDRKLFVSQSNRIQTQLGTWNLDLNNYDYSMIEAFHKFSIHMKAHKYQRSTIYTNSGPTDVLNNMAINNYHLNYCYYYWKGDSSMSTRPRHCSQWTKDPWSFGETFKSPIIGLCVHR